MLSNAVSGYTTRTIQHQPLEERDHAQATQPAVHPHGPAAGRHAALLWQLPHSNTGAQWTGRPERRIREGLCQPTGVLAVPAPLSSVASTPTARESRPAISPLPSTVQTLAEIISDDYRRAYMGKWHLGDEIFPQRGFDEWIGTEDTYCRFYSSPERLEYLSPYHHFLIDSGFKPDSEMLGRPTFSRHQAASLDEPYTKAAFLGRQAAEFIAGVGDQPFCLFVSYLEPHPAAYRAVE